MGPLAQLFTPLRQHQELCHPNSLSCSVWPRSSTLLLCATGQQSACKACTAFGNRGGFNLPCQSCTFFQHCSTFAPQPFQDLFRHKNTLVRGVLFDMKGAKICITLFRTPRQLLWSTIFCTSGHDKSSSGHHSIPSSSPAQLLCHLGT